MSLMEQLAGAAMRQMTGGAAQRTGMDQGAVEKLMPMAMAALMGGLKKNISQGDGAQALASALDRHDGSLLGQADQVHRDDVVSDGQRILGHILGGKQNQTEMALSKAAGVDQNQIRDLMAMAAPMLLAQLGKAKREQGLDASALAGLVHQETTAAQQAAPNEMAGLMGFLDQDGDGDFKDDLLEQAGKSLLGGLFGRK